MKRKLLRIAVIILPSVIFAQVGINQTAPVATLDILSKNSTSATKALKISNATPTELLTLQDNGNMGINSAIVANNTAQLNVDSGAATKSVLKLNNISNTKDKTATAINYNIFSPLSVDANGNVMAQYDIRTTSAATNTANIAMTFDGTYNASTTAQNFITLDGGSIVQFQLLTDFVLGDTANGGSVLYADVTWSRHGGFVVSTYGYEASTGTNAMTVSINNALPANSIGTETLTFDFATGTDLTISAVLNGGTGASNVIGNLQYKTSAGTSVPINVANSFRSR